jgi:hypothetical protein
MLRRLAVFSALTLASLTVAASPGGADGTLIRWRIPYVTFGVNVCAPGGGEIVTMTGTLQLLEDVVGSGSETSLVEGHFTGTGSQGNSYVVDIHERIVLAAEGSFDHRFHAVLVSLGASPNFMVMIHASFPPYQLTAINTCTG